VPRRLGPRREVVHQHQHLVGPRDPGRRRGPLRRLVLTPGTSAGSGRGPPRRAGPVPSQHGFLERAGVDIMSRRNRRHVLPLLTILLAAGHGCNDGTPAVDSSTNEATVTGVVRVKGVPADGGEVVFNPSNRFRIVPSKTATIGADGTYTVSTYTGGNE